MNPLWNTVVIGGFYNGERWLLPVDSRDSDRLIASHKILENQQLTRWWPFGSVQFPRIRGQTGSGLWGTNSGHRLWSVPGPGESQQNSIVELITLMFVYGAKSKTFLSFAASDEGGGGKQGRDLQAGGSRPDWALPQSVVLQRRSLLQQSESTQQHVSLHRLIPPYISLSPSLYFSLCLPPSHIEEYSTLTVFCCIISVWDCHSNEGGCGDRGSSVVRD